MGVEARRAVVRGLVQGVAFRHYTKVRARELGIAGWVRNLPDGSVEVWGEGEAAALEELDRWLRIGPPAARVQSVEISAESPANHARFVVLREMP
jgi:acylphosphatase